jgi:ATP-grasp domain
MIATSPRPPATATADADDPSVRRLLTVLLGRYGIPDAETVTADGADSAVEAAWWLGFPVTMIADGPRLAGHAATVRHGVATPAQVRLAYCQLAAMLGPAMTGVRMRRQPQEGAEVVVRVTRDRGDGAQVSLVLGGPAGALVRTGVTRAAPLTARDARDMLDELRGGSTAAQEDSGAETGPVPTDLAAPDPAEPAPLDLAALAGLLERVSRLAADVPQVLELELNPVIVTRCGAAVAGVHGRFRPSRAARTTSAKLRRVS